MITTWLSYLSQDQRECTWAENFLDSENSGVEIKCPWQSYCDDTAECA